MASRTFTDKHGRVWTVWSVVPSWVERRAVRDRRFHDLDEYEHAARDQRKGPRRRGLPDLGPRVKLSDAMAGGWLAFESSEERRRLVPIPEGWEDASEAELQAYCAKAAVAPPRRRLIE
jgi:hypothetical protein